VRRGEGNVSFPFADPRGNTWLAPPPTITPAAGVHFPWVAQPQALLCTATWGASWGDPWRCCGRRSSTCRAWKVDRRARDPSDPADGGKILHGARPQLGSLCMLAMPLGGHLVGGSACAGSV